MSQYHSKIKVDGNLECLKCYDRYKRPLEPFLTYSEVFGQPCLFFHCSECRSSSADCPGQKHEVDYQVYSKSKVYVLSVAGMPKLPQLQKVKAIEPMNFLDMQVDKLIVNMQSPGYNSGGILYLPNKNLLVACSKDGRIDIWSMGDEVEPVTDFSVGNSVKCMKYIVTAKGRSLLAIGVSTEIQIYEIQGNKPELIKILDCQADVKSLEYVAKELTEDGKLVSVSSDNVLREWDITSLKCCSERSLKENNIIESPSRILYLREKGMLALNSPNEIYLIKLDDKSFSKRIISRGAKISMGYLPNKHQLVVRADRISVALLDIANDFERNISGDQTILESLVFETTYIANQDETQMIYNKDSSTIMVHDFIRGVSPRGFHYMRNLVQSISAIETIPDQNRLIIGDDSTGTILILRTNLKSTPAAPRAQTRKIVEEIKENNAISLEAAKPSGGLFGNSNTNNASLFSNSGSNTSGSGGLFSNLNNSSSGGGLFSNNNRPSGGLFSNNNIASGGGGGGLFSNNNRPVGGLFSNNNAGSGGGGLFSNNNNSSFLNNTARGGGGLFGNSRRSGGSSLLGKKLSIPKASGSTAKKASASKKTAKSSLNKKALASASKKKVEKVKAKTSRPAKPTSKNQKVKEAKTRAVKAVSKKASPKKKTVEEDEKLSNRVIEFVRIRDGLKNSKSKKKKEEPVWVVFPEDEEKEDSKVVKRERSQSPKNEEIKRGRSKSPKGEKGKKEKQKSEEKEKDRSRSRSKSQNVSSKKSIHETIKGAKELVKGIRQKMNAKRKQDK